MHLRDGKNFCYCEIEKACLFKTRKGGIPVKLVSFCYMFTTVNFGETNNMCHIMLTLVTEKVKITGVVPEIIHGFIFE